MKKIHLFGSMIVIIGFVAFYSCDNGCTEQTQYTYIKNISPEWPLVLKINWWANPGNWNYATVNVDSNGVMLKRVRSIIQAGQFNGSGCPPNYYENLILEYNDKIDTTYTTAYHDILGINPAQKFAPQITLESNYANQKLTISYLPVDSGNLYGHSYYATYNFNNLSFQNLRSVPYYDSSNASVPAPTESPKNAFKVDVQSFGITYHNVWEFPVSISSYPKGYKTLYIDPTNGLIKYELNNGTVVDIQP